MYNLIMKFNTIKKIDGFDNYMAGILGNIFDMKKGVTIKDSSNGWAGYRKVDIYGNDGRRISKTVHRLVYAAFNGKIPNGLVINHLDENKENNALSNLQLTTRAENNRYGNRAKKIVESKKNGTSLKKEYEKNRKYAMSQETINKHSEITKAYWNGKEGK